MRPSQIIIVLAVLALSGCANGFTPESDGTSSGNGSGLNAFYNSDYQGGELTRSPLDRNSDMVQ